jgi:beta-galactosidase
LIWEGGNQSVTAAHGRELRGYMDQYDPHGGRAYGHRRADKTTGQFMDVSIGTEGSREQSHLPVVEGEYNREEAPRRVWDRFTPPWRNYHAKGTYDLTGEQFAVNQVAHFVRKLGAASHCGGGNWIFTDSTSGGRLFSEVARVSGEVDGVRLPKEAYFACAAMWREDPTVHIIGHWNYPAGTTKPVYVVSNCEAVELFVNGQSLGFGKVSDRHLFTFESVEWRPGAIKAVGYRDGEAIAEQTKRTTGEPVALRLTSITGPGGLRASGSDVVLVDVEAVDKDGYRCPTFYGRVDFETTGPGVWRGGYNSGKLNSINHSYLDLECGINRVAIRSTLESGTITLNARSQRLRPATLRIESRPVTIKNGTLAEPPTVPAQGPLTPPPPSSTTLAASVAATTEPAAGAFIKDFSYSGEFPTAAVQRNAGNGKKIYSDRAYEFEKLPKALIGADWLQLPVDDKLYSAVDLISFAVKQNGVMYIAHDDRLPRPEWLTASFTATDMKLSVAKATLTLFKRAVRANETLTLGENTENAKLTACTMYVVFVQDAQKPSAKGEKTAPSKTRGQAER